MIIVELLGGLGNQMFQYALGRRLANDFQTSLYVDCALLEDRAPGRHAVNRNYALDIFNAEILQAPVTITMKYSAWGLPRYLRPLARSVGLARQSLITRERVFGFDAPILKSGRNAYLSGMWQSFQYFAPVEELVRKDFQFRQPIIPEANEIAKRIQTTKSVCVHVRRTDYVSHQNSSSPLGFVGLDYYRNGVRQILSESPDAEFFVFSDDLNWCKETLVFIPNVTFVPTEYSGFKDSTHLQLMASCKTFLIPNSTFSWWAAWLCARPEKIVYVPDRWFRDTAMDASGFYPDGWIRLSTESADRAIFA